MSSNLTKQEKLKMKRLAFVLLSAVLISGCHMGTKCSNDMLKDGKVMVSDSNRKFSKPIMLQQSNLQRKNSIEWPVVYECPITPAMYNYPKIPPIYRSNNLRKRVGYATYAKGDFIRIIGIVTDSKCAPVSSATVQIWHADANGYYKYKTLKKNYLNDNRMYRKSSDRFERKGDPQSDENFSGSGSTITDNLGRFQFSTILPGAVRGKPPIVMIRIIHRDFEALDTVMYFPENIPSNLNEFSKKTLVARKLGQSMIQGENTETVYSFNITLGEENKYLQY